MAEQTYDLTQTGAEVQAIINDANNVKGAGAQTTLTTESVLLKDTNGQYHKILKSSFTEAIRDTLAGLLVNNDKGTTINQIAAIASGDFGSVTPANLASVLGGEVVVKPSNTDPNTLTDAGITYQVEVTTSTSYPCQGKLIVKVIKGEGNRLVQNIYSVGYAHSYHRTRDNASTWTQWCRDDNFGCNTPADLASLLGDSGKMGVKKYTRTIAANTTIQYSATVWGCSLMLIQISGAFGTSRYLSKINTGEEILNAGTAKDQKDINYYIESGAFKIQNNTNAEVTLKMVALSFDDLQ